MPPQRAEDVLVLLLGVQTQDCNAELGRLPVRCLGGEGLAQVVQAVVVDLGFLPEGFQERIDQGDDAIFKDEFVHLGLVPGGRRLPVGSDQFEKLAGSIGVLAAPVVGGHAVHRPCRPPDLRAGGDLFLVRQLFAALGKSLLPRPEVGQDVLVDGGVAVPGELFGVAWLRLLPGKPLEGVHGRSPEFGTISTRIGHRSTPAGFASGQEKALSGRCE